MQALPLQTRNIDHTGDTNFDIVELRNDLQANITITCSGLTRMLPWPFASKVNCDNALLCRQIYTSAVTSRGTRLEIELSQSALGQRFLGSNHIRRRRRVCMTKCG